MTSVLRMTMGQEVPISDSTDTTFGNRKSEIDSLRILVVEDDDDDFLLLDHMLRASVRGRVERASSVQQAIQLTASRVYDLYLLDYRLGAQTGFDFLKALKQPAESSPFPISHDRLPNVVSIESEIGMRKSEVGSRQPEMSSAPVIFLTGHGDEDIAVEAMKAGAVDYLAKSKLTQVALQRAIAYARSLRLKDEEVRQAHRELQARERHFRTLVENSSDSISLVDPANTILYASPSSRHVVGYSPEELVGHSTRQWIHPDDEAALRHAHAESLARPGKPVTVEYRMRQKELPIADFRLPNVVSLESEIGSRKSESEKLTDRWRWIEATAVNRLDDPDVRALVVNHRDITDKVRAREQLRESERQYRMLFENANDAIIIFDPETEEILEANARACQVYGYPRAELLGRSLKSMTKDVARGESQLRLLLAAGSCRNFESVHRRRDGAEIPVLVSSSVIDYRGRRAVLTLNRDIGELKQAQQAVELNEMRLEALHELSQMGQAQNFRFPTSDFRLGPLPNQQSEIGNRKSEITSGLQPAPVEPNDEITHFALEKGIQLTGSCYGYLAFATEEEDALILHAWSDATLRDCTVPQRQTIYRLDQTGLWTEALRSRKPVIANDFAEATGHRKFPAGHVPVTSFMSVPIFDNNRIVAVAGVANKEHDYDESDVRQLTLLIDGMWRILQQHKSERALRESERRYRLLFERNQAGVLRSRLDGTILECNDSLARTMGYVSGGELVGKQVADYYAEPEQRGHLVQQLEERGDVANVELQFRRHDGKPVWLLANVSLRQDDPAGPVVEATTVDITERRQLQEQLLHSQKMEAVGHLAGGIAHDFNNLLMVILSYTELIVEGVADSSPLRKNAEEVQKAARKAATLTRQLLAFSRKQVLSPRLLDLNQVMAENGKLLPRLIGENIEIAIHPGAHLWPVKADPVQLDQVLMNLAVNARDAMPNGGRLTLETTNVRLDEEYAATHANVEAGEYVMLAVTDTGCGMPADVLRHIFEPFFTTKSVGHGTGLGLPTVYGIVQQSGGSIWVYSEVGHGTVFKIYLPRAHAEGFTNTAAAAPGGDRTGGHETILLVEDEEALRQVTSDYLRARGYTVLQARNAAEALSLAAAHPGPIHVLVTDVVMPGESGRMLAEKLQAVRTGTRVLYMSGYTEATVVQHGIVPGAMFLQKPFALADLSAKVRQLLESPAAA